jgi:antitoxin (DNA-binding transcriptional repressor) of toxin-antitoxin stability system
MKVIDIQKAKFKECTEAAQHERVVLTEGGRPIALLVGVVGLDLEQIEFGHSDEFWKLIRQRRTQKSIGRSQLDERLAEN